ncbi:Protein CBR-PQBP-1.2 [Aphelenchoides bicaudatus]|nr:Protein CBR-PQBP-1.2 [Aphelenchoides bicaudatus]
MPLPAALLAKLQKRGIIKTAESGGETYVEHHDEKKQDGNELDENGFKRYGAPGCPNRWINYHVCVQFCYDHWGDGVPANRLGEKYHNARNLMLIKYPLPEEWKEIYDPGVKRHYYWNAHTDEVAWLPPRHPNHVAGSSAQSLAKEFFESKKHKVEEEQNPPSRQRNERNRDDRNDRRWRDTGRDESSSNRRPRDESSLALSQQKDEFPTEMTERDRLKRVVKKQRLDPMDPAAYGDADEGGWGAGLDKDKQTKTGADTTAPGTLFQSRPYKSPGDVMRAQQKK